MSGETPTVDELRDCGRYVVGCCVAGKFHGWRVRVNLRNLMSPTRTTVHLTPRNAAMLGDLWSSYGLDVGQRVVDAAARSKALREANRPMDEGIKRKRLKLDPDLADGCHWTIQDDANATLMELIQQWMDEAQAGEAITIEIVEMTDHEVEELPDI